MSTPKSNTAQEEAAAADITTATKEEATTITCKAAVIWGENEVPKVEEIQVEAPRKGEVRLKIYFASICHTDVLGCKGFPTPLFPRVLGHEGVGTVESVGEGVKDLKSGDLVIPTYLGECGECENCRSGKTNLCQTYPLQAFTGLMPGDGSNRMWVRGKPLYHFLSCSTWSEYTVVDVNYCVKIDSRMPLPHASFLSCGFTTGFGAVWREARVHKGSTVAVLGLGAVGLGVIEGARFHGASQIIGIDINENKRAVGEAFGMTHFINPSKTNDKSISDLVKQLTGGFGVDYSFECTGVARLVNEALEATKVGIGKMMMLGAATEKCVEIDFVTLLSCRTFKYAVFGGVRVQSDLPRLIQKCIDKQVKNLDKLLTHHLFLDDIDKGFEMLKEPECVKVLISIDR
ncbi:Alcohol dehydrogenase-like 3 [Striga hermonthica]|uniref:Alcohol dehydrogenase-like 3 n=1 Tax=Striga hermonthica TaxID=68872 RepID=A0A9N7NIF4_STRHE|nr:Alcohol dehydrogenase-like 3 [Striga hermonthica]